MAEKFNLNKFLNQFVVPSDSGTISPISTTDPPADEPFSESNIGEIELLVLNKILSLASLVKLKIPAYSHFESNLEPNLPFGASIRRIVYIYLTKPSLTLGFYRSGLSGKVQHIKSFYTGQDNHDGTIEFADYIDKEKRLVYPHGHVSKISMFPDNNYRAPLKMRRAEGDYWLRYRKLNNLIGSMAMADKKNLEDLYNPESEEGERVIKKVGDQFASSNIALMPREYEFKPISLLPEKIQEIYDNVVRMYCDFYQLPSLLYYLNLKSQTEVTLAGAYKQFRLSVLEPIFNDIAQSMSNHLGSEVTPDFSLINLAGAEDIMRMSQTGVLTINEIRAMINYEEIEGGDEFPETAGTPYTNKEGNTNNENNEKHST